MAISFIVTNLLYRIAHNFFGRYKEFFNKFERKACLPEDIFCQPNQAPIVIIGMGRVGMGAYRAISNHGNQLVWGLDAQSEKVIDLSSQGVEVYCGDAEDAFFWERINLSNLKLVLLALPQVIDAISITEPLRFAGYTGKIAAIARFDDERSQLEELGIDKVFNFYNEAGVGFADESMALINKKHI